MAPPFVYARSSGDGTAHDAALRAAFYGDLRRLRGAVKSLADPRAVFSFFNKGGLGVLHLAPVRGHIEVCKYLVEELRGDVNAPAPGVGDFAGVTPFMTSVQSDDVSTVKYLLDRGGDLTKADGKGRTVLHHAATVGSCKVTEFLLSKGVPVDIHYGYGTPLHLAATNEQDKIVKILLEHHADANTSVTSLGSALMGALLCRSLKCMKLLIKGGADVNRMTSLLMTPLVFTAGRKDYTNFMQFLLKAGADPNIPDGDQRHLERAKAIFKSQADYAFRLKDYKFASKSYDLAIDAAPSATLYANRSLCKLMLDDGEGALSDALSCRMLRPNWAKACYRQAAAHMLLKEYKQACDALLDAQKLDPGNIEVERELRKARELMKAPDEADK
ncbi:hypothetical protein CFC21_010086 [Triticum aestivum]|uniref:Serine/threonine-protein kinase BSK1-like TPR repeats domain-containing protein n=2 Tax=Triticum aestivum TaxID=4565 RepID=A0A9R1IUC7_WHEAT|nr:serine/threonine-protein phosphatase 6 regulatory ankyrin repeat subunit C-like isoform X3 [Triticum aestivum]KAF6993156.1 hypothetical protein CFC21_010086 [Triticum aestivum]